MVEFQSGRSVGTADTPWPSMVLATEKILDTLHQDPGRSGSIG
jgi:hypothetical protein